MSAADRQYERRKTGEIRTSVFSAEKKRRLFRFRNVFRDERAGERLYKGAFSALDAIRKAKSLPADETGGIYIYGLAISYMSAAEGKISGGSLCAFISDCAEKLCSAELNLLPDMLKIAAAERVCELSTAGKADGDELLRLFSADSTISQIDFKAVFFMFCEADKILSRDSVYPICTAKTKLMYISLLGEYAKKHGMGESEAAERILIEAQRRETDVFGLLSHDKKAQTTAYFISLFTLTAALTALFCGFSGMGFYSLLLAIPTAVALYDLCKQFLSGIFLRRCDGTLARLGEGQALESTKCLIAVTTLLFGEKRDCAVFDGLEAHYLRNRGKNYTFAVLGDLGESDTAVKPCDGATVAYAEARINALNEKYGGGFALFVRCREFCECQDMYLGRERKRGGVLELCRFLRGADIKYTAFVGDRAALSDCAYLLTLDADTDLFFGAVKNMLGIMLHPSNKPVFSKAGTAVTGGHAVLQPTVICSLKSASETAFSLLTGGAGGIDVYSGTGRELYQCVTGIGNFCGKGMIDIDAYLRVCDGFFAEERVLSHDLPEGILMRCAVASDVVLTDGTPKNALSYYCRLHRWIRGDLQSLVYLKNRVNDESGKKIENPMSRGGRYRIADNVLRHAVPLCAILSAGFSLIFGLKSAAITLLFAFAYALYPTAAVILKSIFSGGAFLRGGLSLFAAKLGSSVLRLLYTLSAAAHEAFVFADAAIRTAWRFAVSRRHFLDWKSAAQSDLTSGGLADYYASMILSALLGAAALFSPLAGMKLLGLLWFVFPGAMFLCSQKRQIPGKISRRNAAYLKNCCRHSFMYFSEFVGVKTNFLPPDNYQVSPVEKTAMRTSPTNIGMYLLAVLSARDFGFIDSKKLAEYACGTAETLKKLLRWHGHFYNWYDIKTLEVIGEPFISTVDSGNLTVSLAAFCEGIKEYASECVKLLDAAAVYSKIIAETDFAALYDAGRRLFPVGFNVRNSAFSESYYDVFMSEARMTGYYAVSSGQVPAEHYYAPARREAIFRGKKGVISWSGTAFEFFMPSLLLPTERGSVSDAGLSLAAKAQRSNPAVRFVGGRRISVFGISESEYFGFDHKMNYQYRAFGIRELSLDPMCRAQKVISPYSSFLMLCRGSAFVLANLRALTSLGAFGKYGFYEAVDFCKNRVGGGYAVIKSYMAHHLGMSMVASANACFENVFVRRFLRNPNMRAGELLLSEKPAPGATAFVPETLLPHEKPHVPVQSGFSEAPYEYNVLYPQVSMISNNKSRIIASSSGHIALYDGAECICFSAFDRYSLSGGLCAVAEADGNLISAVPLGYTDAGFSSRFSFRAEEEKLTYASHHEKGKLSVGFFVTLSLSPDYAGYGISVSLSGNFRYSRFMLYFEPVMQEEKAFLSHRSFSGLFIESKYEESEKILLVRRRPRGESSDTYLGVTAKSPGGFDFEIPCGGLLPGYDARDIAKQIFLPCKGSAGAPVIPSCRLVCSGERRAVFSLGYSKNRDDLIYFMNGKPKNRSLGQLLSLQRSSAQIGRNAAPLERFLLRSVYFPHPERHFADAATLDRLKAHPMEKNRLYKYSLSGENPMIAARLYRSGGIQSENLRTLLSLFRYACIRGLRYDFLILYSENDAYRAQTLSHINEIIAEAGCENFLCVPCGIYPINIGKLAPCEEYALGRLCGAILDLSVPLQSAIRENKYFVSLSESTEKLVTSKERTAIIPCAAPKTEKIEHVRGGEFHTSGFLCDKKLISLPWAHVVSSRALGFVATVNSAGYTFASNSALCRLTPHNAGALTEDSGETLILRVYDDIKGGFADYDMCACSAYADYRFGEAEYYGKAAGISYTVSLTADKKLAVKYFDVSVSGSHLRAELICRIVPCLGQKPDSAGIYLFETDNNRHAVIMSRLIASDCNRRAALVCSDIKCRLYTDSAAVKTDGKVFCGTDDCAAVSAKLPSGGGEVSLALVSFCGETDLSYIIDGFVSGKRSRAGETPLPQVTLKSGDPLLDLTVNKWFFYQSVESRLIARSGFYQSGGAYGFRDQLQDSLSLDCGTLKRQILFCACHQYREGDVMHWWHNIPKAHAGIRTRCSDDGAWLIYACCEYAERTADYGIFDIKLPFLVSSPLDKDEGERYERAVFSKEKAPLYDHICLSAERLCRRGRHGLCLFGAFDWNDGMNGVGRLGKGESVWLSQFASAMLGKLAQVCFLRGDENAGKRFRTVGEELQSAVESCAFEGDRYIRGYYDDGGVLGSASRADCKLDLLPQAFSALTSDGRNAERVKIALETMKKELFDYRNGLVRLLYPPFDLDRQSPGYIKGYVPGVRENGGQYTHAAVWAAMAQLKSGDFSGGAQTLEMLNPAIRSRSAGFSGKYLIEPYVLAGDVYSVGTLAGRGGWSWYTGAAGWYRQAVISGLCGYREYGGGFCLDPALSEKFPSFSLDVRLGGSAYSVRAGFAEKNSLIFDGREISCNPSVMRETLFIPDGEAHTVIFLEKNNEADAL